MSKQIHAGSRNGSVIAPSSKSHTHRLILCASFSNSRTILTCNCMSNDILATIECLNSLGANINISNNNIIIKPIKAAPSDLCHLRCEESGSTLRFLLPIVGVLGVRAVFHMEGRLCERPIEPLASLLRSHGMLIEKKDGLLYCSGKLTSGDYFIPGNVSSQYISAPLMALPLIGNNSRLIVTDKIESGPYIDLTETVLQTSGIKYVKKNNTYFFETQQTYSFAEQMSVEGDWSNSAFFLSAGAFSEKGITVRGLNISSAQGDKKIVDLLQRFGADVLIADGLVTVKKNKLNGIVIDASSIPDLVPVLSVVAAASDGQTKIINASRLRLKESDRLESTSKLISSLGGAVTLTEDGMIITGKKRLKGGMIDSCNDHRIAMSAAVAASACDDKVVINDPDCINKSYPGFFDDFDSLEVIN